MSKSEIELIKCDSGDWKILRVNLGEDFEYSGHSIPDFTWIKLLNLLGYKIIETTISDEDMENSNY